MTLTSTRPSSGSAFAAFYNAGQDCTAASRVIAHEAVYDEVVQRLAEAARGTAIGR